MLAIIGGSGLESLPSLTEENTQAINTPFGDALLTTGKLKGGKSVLFLARHGPKHTLAPHVINYRANCWALKQAKATSVLSCNVVGGISGFAQPGTVVLPRQIIDYTWGRQHTFYDGQHYPGLPLLEHVDFGEPFSSNLLKLIQTKLTDSHISFASNAVYGCTQGPRLETAAEIRRLKMDGCDIVGMTAMPEAALAKELGLEYVAISYVVNWAAGIVQGKAVADGEAYTELPLDEIMKNVKKGADKVGDILEELVVIPNI